MLYVGQFRPGTTSFSRGLCLKELLPDREFSAIDILEPFYGTNRPIRSMGFRWKAGPLIARINDFIRQKSQHEEYDLVWVDKAVFVTEKTTSFLRSRARNMIHFTPDPAFRFHRSRHFNRSLPQYDAIATTKSYEVDEYAAIVGADRVVLVTQGYDPSLHVAQKPFRDRVPGVCFIGHYEKDRLSVIQSIAEEGIPVFVAGRKWKRHVRKLMINGQLTYGGEGLYGGDYVNKLNEYQVGLGLLSSWIPELHTTRTFEIPACGSLLVTERNRETASFFGDEEVLFYDSPEELVKKLKHLLDQPDLAESVAENGHQRITSDGYDYKSIVASVLRSADDI